MNRKSIARLAAGTVVWIFAMVLPEIKYISFLLYLAAYLIIGFPVLVKAIKNIFTGNFLDENFLMLIASVGAFCLKEYTEAVAVMLFYGIGDIFEKYAVRKSRKSVTELMDLRPDYANKEVDGEIITTDPEEINVGDILIVKPGEKFPLDGKIVFGKTSVDTKSLTGESVPVTVSEGDEVLSGCVNLSGAVKIEVTKSFEQSTASKILELVETAASQKAVSEKFITKFARYYTPAVVVCAALLAIVPVFFGQPFVKWLSRALLFLVVSCPCALVISVPLAFFGSIGGASKKGILIKGGNTIEALSKVKNAVFDKTGTLTEGSFEITEISAESVTENELLECAAKAESYSNHPIAISIKKAFGKETDLSEIENSEEITGMGMKVESNGKTIYAGNSKLMQKIGISISEQQKFGTYVHIACDNKYLGFIVISDVIKADAKSTIEGLKQHGINKTVMLTGDIKNSAESIAEELGLDEVYYNLLPEGKLEKLDEIEKEGITLYAGDGINDAPVLMRADIGVAMGMKGSDAAMEAADVVLMEDNPSKIIDAIKLSEKTMKIVVVNIIFALAVKIGVMILGALGIANMWAAVFADVGVSVIAISNSIRTLK